MFLAFLLLGAVFSAAVRDEVGNARSETNQGNCITETTTECYRMKHMLNASYDDVCSKTGLAVCNKPTKKCECSPGFCVLAGDPGKCQPDPEKKCRLVIFDFDSTLSVSIDEVPAWFTELGEQLDGQDVGDVDHAERFAEKLKEEGEGAEFLETVFGPKDRIQALRQLLQDLSDNQVRISVLSYHQDGQKLVLAYLKALELDQFFDSIHAASGNAGIMRYQSHLERDSEGWHLQEGSPMLIAGIEASHRSPQGFVAGGHKQDTLRKIQANPATFLNHPFSPDLLVPEIMLVDDSFEKNLKGLSDWGFKAYTSGSTGLIAEDATKLLQQCNLK